ncbi:hypothetical protein [Pseudorhodoferax sp. Leaf267]|uniref:hypothetical protein n=1 Tax=Pseudorhodoferax sp. Leaf267 TaxID=1736316 RepID=UPI0012E0CD64|nr:hypothetical protein [Pseudorhodoferax sp. Leaf267]
MTDHDHDAAASALQIVELDRYDNLMPMADWTQRAGPTESAANDKPHRLRPC